MTTRKEYLSSLNPPLARMGRGRLSAEANAEIERCVAKGMTFDDFDGKSRIVTTKEPKTPVVPVTQSNPVNPDDIVIPSPRKRIDPASYDAKIVREWGRENGHTVGSRGRIHPDVVSAYMEAHKGSDVPTRDEGREDTHRPTMARVRHADTFSGIDPATKNKITKSYRDCCFNCSWSIGYCLCPVPQAISHDTVTRFDLRPVR